MDSGRIVGLQQEELDLAATLRSGQVFRWAQDAEGVWTGMIGRRAARLQQAAEGTLYWETDEPGGEAAVRDFLRLGEVNLAALAEEWCAADPFFAEAWARQPGIRVLRQDPVECFFSFLCASVAPIARISAMLRAITGAYGEPGAGGECRAFPGVARLAEAEEAALRGLGLGFRARRVVEAAQALLLLPEGWLLRLRDASYAEAKRELMGFFGVGEKIADCVCLFSLDKDGAIPVDTHIWRIACARYVPDLAGKSLTPAAYARVGEAFRDRFGPRAGWAQQTLFYQAVNRPRP